jgi:hypothetical protein
MAFLLMFELMEAALPGSRCFVPSIVNGIRLERLMV